MGIGYKQVSRIKRNSLSQDCFFWFGIIPELIFFVLFFEKKLIDRAQKFSVSRQLPYRNFFIKLASTMGYVGFSGTYTIG
jgi:hypothetical protein